MKDSRTGFWDVSMCTNAWVSPGHSGRLDNNRMSKQVMGTESKNLVMIGLDILTSSKTNAGREDELS